MHQAFCWRLPIVTTRSLARVLPTAFLGRILIFPPMSGRGLLFPHSVHHRTRVLGHVWPYDFRGILGNLRMI
ncbi:hypothetical protein EDB87DRAFT_1220986 [Lactarius vividus]|nr:hypothetical protein EDB87DRAFT_1220986 [Lactarius vividus]